MNRFEGNIVKVETSGPLSLATIALGDGVAVTAIVIETPESAPYLREGGAVSVLFKETEVILATGPCQEVGIENRIPGTVRSVEAGPLLSKVSLETASGGLEAVVSSKALASLGLERGDQAVALVKINEVMLLAQ